MPKQCPLLPAFGQTPTVWYMGPMSALPSIAETMSACPVPLSKTLTTHAEIAVGRLGFTTSPRIVNLIDIDMSTARSLHATTAPENSFKSVPMAEAVGRYCPNIKFWRNWCGCKITNGSNAPDLALLATGRRLALRPKSGHCHRVSRSARLLPSCPMRETV
jgi:hypothetical protein